MLPVQIVVVSCFLQLGWRGLRQVTSRSAQDRLSGTAGTEILLYKFSAVALFRIALDGRSRVAQARPTALAQRTQLHAVVGFAAQNAWQIYVVNGNALTAEGTALPASTDTVTPTSQKPQARQNTLTRGQEAQCCMIRGRNVVVST